MYVFTILTSTFYTKLGIASRPRCGDMSGFPRKAFAKFCGSYGALSGGGVAFAFQVGAMGWDRKGGYPLEFRFLKRVSPQPHPLEDGITTHRSWMCLLFLNLRSSLIFVHEASIFGIVGEGQVTYSHPQFPLVDTDPTEPWR
jgi:hypothetical protein